MQVYFVQIDDPRVFGSAKRAVEFAKQLRLDNFTYMNDKLTDKQAVSYLQQGKYVSFGGYPSHTIEVLDVE